MTLTETVPHGPTELSLISNEKLDSILRGEFIGRLLNAMRSPSETQSHYELALEQTDEPANLSRFLGVLESFRTIGDLIGFSRKLLPNRIADRLIFLRGETLEPGERPLSTKSLRHFLTFLLCNERLRNCLIGLAPNGNLHAEWHPGNDNHLVLEFLPGGSVRYAAICPSPDHPDEPRGVSGTLPASDVLKGLAPCEVLRWATA